MRDVTYTEMSRTSAAFPRWSLREPEDVVGMCVDMRDRTRMLTHTILSVCADASPESEERAEDLTVRVCRVGGVYPESADERDVLAACNRARDEANDWSASDDEEEEEGGGSLSAESPRASPRVAPHLARTSPGLAAGQREMGRHAANPELGDPARAGAGGAAAASFHPAPPILKCDLCDRTFETARAKDCLRQHIQQVHGPKTRTFTCAMCPGWSTSSKASWCSHTRKKHPTYWARHKENGRGEESDDAEEEP